MTFAGIYKAYYLKWHLQVMLIIFSLLKRFDVSDDFLLSLLDIFWFWQVTPYLCIGTCDPRKGSIIRFVECIRKHAYLGLPTPPSKQFDPPSSLSFIVANSPQPPTPFPRPPNSFQLTLTKLCKLTCLLISWFFSDYIS